MGKKTLLQLITKFTLAISVGYLPWRYGTPISKFTLLSWLGISSSYGADESQHVWFGVGTFGTSDDPMQGLGNCYRLSVVDTVCGGDAGAGDPLERNIIAQSVNTGSDVANIQFDLQVCPSQPTLAPPEPHQRLRH